MKSRPIEMRGAPEMKRVFMTESQQLTPETERSGSEHGGVAADACWLAGIRARRPDALKHLYHRYRVPVIRFLSLVELDRAPAEACLDVFEEVWDGGLASRPDRTVAEWVLGVAYRVLLRRAQSADTLASEKRIGTEAGRAAQGLPGIGGRPRRLLSVLSWEQRVVVALVYASELSIESIEAVTGMTHKEITGHLSKACDLLRRQAHEPTAPL